MPEVSDTEAAANLPELLDAVEYRGERYTILRRGKAVARLDPAFTARGSEVKALLGEHRIDAAFSRDIESTRTFLA